MKIPMFQIICGYLWLCTECESGITEICQFNQLFLPKVDHNLVFCNQSICPAQFAEKAGSVGKPPEEQSYSERLPLVEQLIFEICKLRT